MSDILCISSGVVVVAPAGVGTPFMARAAPDARAALYACAAERTPGSRQRRGTGWLCGKRRRAGGLSCG